MVDDGNTSVAKDEKGKETTTSAATDAVPVVEPLARTSEHRRAKPLTAVLFLIVTLALGFFGGWLGSASHEYQRATVQTQKVVLSNEGRIVSSIAKNVGQSVVSVNVTSQTATGGFGLFGGGGSEKSAGTGIILTPDGLIVTNRHVVPSGTTSVSVTLADGTQYDDVRVVGRTGNSDSLDVAFLKIQDTKGKKLVPASIGDSSKVAVGDPVVAIGNALGQFQNTVTAGIISGYGRSLQASNSSGTNSENLDDLFQTDAAINEGNSGGPLVNLEGQVIGINTAIASGSQSIGFAIPINDVAGLIDSVKQTGKLQRPYLGVIYVPLTSDVAQQYALSIDRGAYIPKPSEINQKSVLSGGPAEKAGVKAGDIIAKVDGTTIDQATSLTSVLDKHKVGDTINLTVIRAGKTLNISVTLGAAPTN
ncbi:MAG: trypsin-like peptidase domain-containing protein [Candidatus Saccharimonadales bacterium]